MDKEWVVAYPWWQDRNSIVAVMFVFNAIAVYWAVALNVLPAPHYTALFVSLLIAALVTARRKENNKNG